MAKHVDVTHIIERRLRPIYDCLDNGNNKKALQEAEKVLKKQKDLQCARVLKALALIRLGRQEESLAILKEVHDEAPTDDATLQAMTICYRELHMIEEIATIYELAVKKSPTNEELFSHLFMAYVRLGDYKKQQTVAMNLYKLKSKNPYYFWAVMSLYMQAISHSDESIAQKVMLPLAEKMCKKFIDEEKIQAEAEMDLYLMILERQEKYQEMINVLESELYSNLVSNYLHSATRRKAGLLVKLKRYKIAFEEYKKLIENNLDQIEYYMELYDIACHLDQELTNNHDIDASNNNHPDASDYVSKVVNFIEECILTQSIGLIQTNDHSSELNDSLKNFTKKHHLLRGPYIGKFLILQMLNKERVDGDANHQIEEFSSNSDLLFQYFRNFGSKFACIYDMFSMISKCDLKDAEDLVYLMKSSHLVNLDDHKDLEVIQRNLCYYHIRHYIGQHDKVIFEDGKMKIDYQLELISKLIDHYDLYYENLPIGTQLSQTEPQPADAFIVLIGQILFGFQLNLDEYIIEDDVILQMILMFKKAMSKSPSNYYVKIFLINLYNSIGAVKASHALIETLDIKHIQYDTLGYLMSSPLLKCGLFSKASMLFGNVLRFYAANFKDTLDYLISCYKYGSFTKVQEIIGLRDRLNNSLQHSFMSIEKTVLELILESKNHNSTENIINCMEIDCEKDKFVWEKLCDNRDFKVFRSNHMAFDEIIEEKKVQTFNDDILWLKIRNLLIRGISASHHCLSEGLVTGEVINGTTNGSDKKSFLEILKKINLNLEEYIQSLTQTKTNSKYTNSILPIHGPQPSRLYLYAQSNCSGNHLIVLKLLLDFIINLQEELSDKNSVMKSFEELEKIIDYISKFATEEYNLCLIRFGKILEHLVNSIETLSFSVIFIGICKSIVKKKINDFNKKSKKKKEHASISGDNIVDSFTETYSKLVSGFENCALKLKEIIKTLKIPLQDDNFNINIINSHSTYLLKDINSSTPESLPSIRQKITKSYLQSTKELNELLDNKIKYLESLKL